MASITQSIPSYTGGISQQPDEKKFPGQVIDSTNAIPDLTYGLYKRPGSKRIGKLANVYHDSSTVTTNKHGSWFHYYRDETEGSYIGQVDDDGALVVWRCSDGQKMTTTYGTGGETAIKAYLASTNPEDIQFLSINDTTFATNRSKPVLHTGTTDAAPDTHYAYVEVIRTENGRQYSLNAYNGEGTTNISRATRVKISSDTLDEGSSTGHCPGIGTQVFSVNSGSKKNLTFRITALGQQGQARDYNNDDAGDVDVWKCTYNRQIQLLHGGEGWSTGDTDGALTVTLDQALTNYTYTVGIEDHETVAVKADIKAVRPAPTPFDADTAVTIDTILGGIVQELSGTGITCTVIGNGIYMTKSSAFQIEIVNKDLMRVMQSSVNDVSLLPSQCKDGYLVKVANSQDSDQDDYYLKFEGENGKDGSGAWVEVAGPGIVKGFDKATMPHVIQRTGTTTFTVKQYDYPDRRVGDDNTNPIPTFVSIRSGHPDYDSSNIDKYINKVLFFRNRIAFLSGENVITCQPGTLGAPDFWAKTALAVSASDPIDISSSSMFPSALYDGIEINAGLLLSSDDTVLNPDTAKLRSVATYNYNTDIAPISMGVSVGYIDNSGKFSRFNEMINTAREGEPTVGETSKLVPTLLPKNIDLITNSRENQLVLFGKSYINDSTTPDSDIVYGFKYYQLGEKRPQASWFKWKLNTPIKYHFIINDDYYFLDKDDFLQRMSIIQTDTDPSITKDNVNYLIHLDNWTTVTNGTYSATTKLTTFANQTDWIDEVISPNGDLVLIDLDTNANRVAKYAKCTVTNTDDFTVPGDWSTGTHYIGYLYEYNIQLPTIYSTKSEGTRSIADVNASLIIHRINLNFGKIGLYETTLSRVGKPEYTEVYESTPANQYGTSTAPYLEEEIRTIPVYEKNRNVDITLKSSHPAPTTLHSMSWEGDYSPLFYQRV